MGPQKLTKILAPLVVIVFNLSLTVSIYSQVTGATLSGTISDPSGGLIPVAQISIRNTGTGISKDFQADSDGYYTAPNLAPGTYEVRVAAKGFSTVVSTVTLAVGAQQQLNIPMRVGETTQTIQVTQAAPQIDLTSSTLTGQVESQTILDLPLNGRDWTSLATLHPGVNLIETQVDYAQSARGNRGFGAELTISGQRTTNNNYRLDGVSVDDYANSGPGNVIGAALGVDAIQEFSVLTGGFSAEYGKASGGVVNAITKTCTNSYGTVRWTREITSRGAATLLWRSSGAISSAARRVGQSSKTRLSSSETTKDSAKRRASRRQLLSLPTAHEREPSTTTRPLPPQVGAQ